jgi:hypothetical protein
MYTKSLFNSMCKSRDACTELYATTAGVGDVMRAKMEPAGRETREMLREAKEPGFFSTRRRRVRSGWIQAGTEEPSVLGSRVGGVEDVPLVWALVVPFEARGRGLFIAVGGDMMSVSSLKFVWMVRTGVCEGTVK